MITKKTLVIISMLIAFQVQAQRISSGITLNIPGVFSMIHFKQNVYSPMNNFAVYFVNAPDAEKETYNRFSTFGMGKWFHHVGIGLGYLAKVDFKRFNLRFGYQPTFVGASIEFNHFSSIYENIDEYPAVMKIMSFHHRFPILFSVDLKRKNNSPYILAGIEPGYMFARFESMDWDHLFHDRYDYPFLYGIYYDREMYTNLVIGSGIKKKRFEWMLNYSYRIDSGKNNLSTSQQSIDFRMNFFFTYKTFKRTHFLYRDE